ncbi:hypothetical protein B7759_05517 [Burkholderia glumae]|nr:hypothetical protein KS03_4149 [Burkholderia glumae LMG 2196 = ATCC 33617]QKM55968.1 hypothetical protein CG017_04029 [Burkholderia glumae]QTP36876.1 hypothetical protein B7759_05517 [Burkholderia glumae]
MVTTCGCKAWRDGFGLGLVPLPLVGASPFTTWSRSSTSATAARRSLSGLDGSEADRLDQRNQLGDVVTIGAAQDYRDRHSVGDGGDVALRTGSRSIGRVRAGFSPAPTAPTARIDDASTTAREKSSFSAARSFAGSTACSRSRTPACCQSRRRRQPLRPESHPIADGKSRQRMPVIKAHRMPAKAARSATGLRPGYPKRCGFGGGSSGAIRARRWSSRIGLPISLARLSRRPSLTGC